MGAKRKRQSKGVLKAEGQNTEDHNTKGTKTKAIASKTKKRSAKRSKTFAPGQHPRLRYSLRSTARIAPEDVVSPKISPRCIVELDTEPGSKYDFFGNKIVAAKQPFCCHEIRPAAGFFEDENATLYTPNLQAFVRAGTNSEKFTFRNGIVGTQWAVVVHGVKGAVRSKEGRIFSCVSEWLEDEKWVEGKTMPDGFERVKRCETKMDCKEHGSIECVVWAEPLVSHTGVKVDEDGRQYRDEDEDA